MGKCENAFGEVGIKTTRYKKMTGKLNNISDYCVFLAYPERHPSDRYRVLDLKTKTIMVTLMQSGPNRPRNSKIPRSSKTKA